MKTQHIITCEKQWQSLGGKSYSWLGYAEFVMSVGPPSVSASLMLKGFLSWRSIRQPLLNLLVSLNSNTAKQADIMKYCTQPKIWSILAKKLEPDCNRGYQSNFQFNGRRGIGEKLNGTRGKQLGTFRRGAFYRRTIVFHP